MAPLSSTVADSPRSGIDPTLLKLRPRPGPDGLGLRQKTYTILGAKVPPSDHHPCRHAARTRAQRPRRRRASLGCDSASNGDPPSLVDYPIDTDWLFTFGSKEYRLSTMTPLRTVILLV